MDRSQRFMLGAVSVSMLAHIITIAGVRFAMPTPKRVPINEPIEIVLVNQKTLSAPDRPEVLAQTNLDGGGNTDAKQRSKSPLPATADTPVLEQVVEQQKQLEEKAADMFRQLKSDWTLPGGEKLSKPGSDKGQDSQALSQQAREMAAQAAQISKNYQAYQEKPRKAYIGPRAKQTSVAMWADSWAQKIERVGTFSYPVDARGKKLRGQLQVSVEINLDGSILHADISRSSGNPALDQAALRILRLAAPFARLPDDMTDDSGKPATVLNITRTWVFGRDNSLGLD